ncbi:Wdr6 [Symbiodinium sp. KB8]|nr:Wdr6 [Symbiodinium sp. KB8]
MPSQVSISPEAGHAIALKPSSEILRLPDWPLDVTWLPPGHGHLGDLLVAYGRVFLEIWRLGEDGPRRQARLAGPSEVSFLYSASLQALPLAVEAGSVLCAGGTFDGFVVLWTVRPDEAKLEAPLQLSGHEGAIFRTRLFLDATVLLTASDDRTVRLWVEERSPLLHGSVGQLQAKLSLSGSPFRGWRCGAICRGHGCRVWDALLCPIGTLSFGIVSASEDSIVRVFSLEGTLLRELQGHQTRGVRCLEVVVEPLTWASANFTQADLAVISGGEDGAVKLWPLCDVGVSRRDDTAESKGASSRVWHVPQAEETMQSYMLQVVSSTNDWIREVALLSHIEALVATNFGRIYRLLLHVEDDEKVTGTLLFEEPGLCFTCMGLGASTHVWAGCADGRALTLGVHDSRRRWIEAFRQCRVSAAFAARAGHGLLADHAGSVQLWLDDASESAPSRLAEVKLVSSKKGDKNQRLLCAELLADSDPAWLLGDEHGNLHLVDLRGQSHRAVHEGKVLCLKLLSQKDREFLSAGADGTVVHHRIESEVWTQLSSHRPGCGLRHLAHLSTIPRSGMSDVSIPPLLIGAFQSADFVLWDAVAGLEIWRRRCGGAKRPNDLLADGASYTFVFSSASKSLEIHSTFSPAGAEPVAASSAAEVAMAPKGLRQPLHGREIHSACWLHPPSEERPGLLATASEDTSLRLLRFRPSSPERGAALLPEPANVRFPGSVRALAASELLVKGQATKLLLSGGAKGVLRAHLLEEVSSLRCVWSTSLAQDAVAGSSIVEEEDGGAGLRLEERVMALSCINLEASVLACAASSSGILRTWHLKWGAGTSLEADFLQRQRAANTTALCAECFLEQGFAGVVLGSADGKLAACSLTVPGLRREPRDTEPLLQTQLHDAGLNDLALQVLPSEGSEVRLLVLSAGDDHRVALCRLDFALSSEPSCTLQMTRRVDCAHTSAVRAVGWTGPFALSLGLDRRLRVWQADRASCELTERRAQVVSCSEPEALAVSSGLLALAGRGVEVCSLVDVLAVDIHKASSERQPRAVLPSIAVDSTKKTIQSRLHGNDQEPFCRAAASLKSSWITIFTVLYWYSVFRCSWGFFPGRPEP